MRITALIENKAEEGLCAEHGLSVYIEYGQRKYLLDTGASDLFLENAKKMEVPLEEVDMAFLSHAHYDHSGGFEGFFKVNDHAKVFLREEAREACCKEKGEVCEYIGIPENLLKSYSGRFVYVSGDLQADQGVWVISHKTEHLEERGKRAHMYRKIDGTYYPDDFAHEQSLVFETAQGLVVLNSCSHGGIVNIVKEVNNTFVNQRVYMVVGGFHLMGQAGAATMGVEKQEVLELAQDLKNLGVQQIYTGHCTGEPAFEILQDALGERIHYFCTGTVIEMGEKE